MAYVNGEVFITTFVLQERETLEQEIDQLQTERRQLEFHIDRTGNFVYLRQFCIPSMVYYVRPSDCTFRLVN